jgi:hypothetical protein
VKYVKNDPKQGAIISIENLEKMPMPVVLDVKYKGGTTSRVKLPVEIWQRNVSWTFKHASTEEIASITIDPDHNLPDVNSKNNVWTVEAGEKEQDIILDGYLGNFSSKSIPIKITFSEDAGTLVAKATGQPDLSLEPAGKDKFAFEQAGLSMQFNEAKNEMTLFVNGQNFLFTRDVN